MSDRSYSNYRSLFISAGIMALIGWVGLILVLSTTLPTVGPRWLFFFLAALAFTGTSIPFVWYIHRRFSRRMVTPTSTLLRQSILLAFYFELLLWLQINRSLSLSLILLLALGMIGVEGLLRVIERSRWRPSQ